jgi:hypothetical protein
MWTVFQMKLGKFTIPAVKRWVLEHWIEQSKYLHDSNRRYSLQWPYSFVLIQECNYSCSYLLLNCSNKYIHCHISLYKLLVCFVCFILFVNGLLSETTICMLSITIYPVPAQQFYLCISQKHVSAITAIIRLFKRIKRKLSTVV